MDLPSGVTIENRRGGSDVLSMMASDFATLKTSGYIKTQRDTSTGIQRIGHIVFSEGEPVLSIHDGVGFIQGIDALLEIEADSVILDCNLSAVELGETEVSEIRRLYKQAGLNLDEGIASSEGSWWLNAEPMGSSWSQVERLPEFENIISAPEEIQNFTRSMLAKSNVKQTLDSSKALLIDEENPELIFKFASLMAGNGKSILTLSRKKIAKLAAEYSIPSANCLWLSESPGDGNIVATLENLNRGIDEFLWENERAVIIVEGIEYLASLHGENRVLDLIRTLCDKVRNEDHLLVIGCNLLAFDISFRASLETEVDLIEEAIVHSWLALGDLIQDQPIFEDIDQAEALWIETELKTALEANQEIQIETIEGGSDSIAAEVSIEVGQELSDMMKQWAVESSVSDQHNEPSYNPEVAPSPNWTPKFETVENNDSPSPRIDQRGIESETNEIPVEENIVEREHVPLPKKRGMRKAKIIKRKTRPTTHKKSQHESKISSLVSAIAKNVEIEELDSNDNKGNYQKTAHFETKSDLIDALDLSSSQSFETKPDNALTQAMRQKSSKKTVDFAELKVRRELDAVNYISNDSDDYISLETNKKSASKYSRAESNQKRTLNEMSRAERRWSSLEQPSRKRGNQNE
ncbi:MAG: DUF835 domain-containing protein [Candidatus Poseidoniaceae archaeon]